MTGIRFRSSWFRSSTHAACLLHGPRGYRPRSDNSEHLHRQDGEQPSPRPLAALKVQDSFLWTLVFSSASVLHWYLVFDVWAGHCNCNVCPKNLKVLVNMWFSTSFKTH
jgi:hypothetical protein